MPKLIDSSKQARHDAIEEAMHDVIEPLRGQPVGKIDLQEAAALQRYIGVRTNAAGESFTPGELVTAAGIVMEETGAKVQRAPDLIRPRGSRPHGRKSYFFFGRTAGK